MITLRNCWRFLFSFFRIFFIMNRPQTSTRGLRPPSAIQQTTNQGLSVISQPSMIQNQRAMRPGTASKALMTANGNQQGSTAGKYCN